LDENLDSVRPLSSSDIEDFVENGYVVLRNGFDPALAAHIRENELWTSLYRMHGIKKEDPSTWPHHVGMRKVYFASDKLPAEEADAGVEYVEKDWVNKVLNERVLAAIDQLVGGRNRWHVDRFGLGWWAVSWPQPKPDNADWGADGAWHIDGAHFKHKINSAEQALLPIFIFSNIEPEDGGTALAAGSHVAVTKILSEAEISAPDGIPGSQVSRAAAAVPGALDNIIEACGQAGDVVLCHPFLLHARGINYGQNGVESVRFISNPCVQFREEMNVGIEADPEHQSPVERAVSEARIRAMLPLRFGHTSRPQKRRRKY